MRNALAHAPKGQHTVVAAAIRQAFLQPDHKAASETWRHVADQLRGRWPKLGALMERAIGTPLVQGTMANAEHDVLAYMSFPAQHRTKLHSTDVIDKAFCDSGAILSLRGRPCGEERAHRLKAPSGSPWRPCRVEASAHRRWTTPPAASARSCGAGGRRHGGQVLRSACGALRSLRGRRRQAATNCS